MLPEQNQERAFVGPKAFLLAELGSIKILLVWSELVRKKIVSKRVQDSGRSFWWNDLKDLLNINDCYVAGQFLNAPFLHMLYHFFEMLLSFMLIDS